MFYSSFVQCRFIIWILVSALKLFIILVHMIFLWFLRAQDACPWELRKWLFLWYYVSASGCWMFSFFCCDPESSQTAYHAHTIRVFNHPEEWWLFNISFILNMLQRHQKPIRSPRWKRVNKTLNFNYSLSYGKSKIGWCDVTTAAEAFDFHVNFHTGDCMWTSEPQRTCTSRVLMTTLNSQA